MKYFECYLIKSENTDNPLSPDTSRMKWRLQVTYTYFSPSPPRWFQCTKSSVPSLWAPDWGEVFQYLTGAWVGSLQCHLCWSSIPWINWVPISQFLNGLTWRGVQRRPQGWALGWVPWTPWYWRRTHMGIILGRRINVFIRFSKRSVTS